METIIGKTIKQADYPMINISLADLVFKVKRTKSRNHAV